MGCALTMFFTMAAVTLKDVLQKDVVIVSAAAQVDSEGAVSDTETAEINADIVENASDSETNDAENECLLQCNPLGILE